MSSLGGGGNEDEVIGKEGRGGRGGRGWQRSITLWTAMSISSVVTPGFTISPALSLTCKQPTRGG